MKYVYACFELKLKLKDSVAQIKIPCRSTLEAVNYIHAHKDNNFYSKYWIE